MRGGCEQEMNAGGWDGRKGEREGGREGGRAHTYLDVALALLLHELGGDWGECAVR